MLKELAWKLMGVKETRFPDHTYTGNERLIYLTTFTRAGTHVATIKKFNGHTLTVARRAPSA